MLISRKRKIAFVRVPSTGSKSFMQSLKLHCGDLKGVHPDGNDHDTMWDFMQRKHEGFEDLSEYTKIGFVRHPIPWLRSFYLGCNGTGAYKLKWTRMTRIKTALTYRGEKGHEKILSTFLDKLNVTPMTWMTNPHTEELIADKVYRTEDMGKVCKEYGVPSFTYNKEKNDVLLDYKYTDEELDFIKKKFARELKYYPEGL